MRLIFDLETTGLPARAYGTRCLYPYRFTQKYDRARVVSMAWTLSDEDGLAVDPKVFVVVPESFDIPEESSRIHGITHAQAVAEGVSFDAVMEAFAKDLAQCSLLVSHNIEFDANVLKSELARRSHEDIVAAMERVPTYCTMLHGQERMGVRKYPKLSELFAYLYPGEQLQHAHDAMYDVLHCLACYNKLTDAPAALAAPISSQASAC